MTKRLLLAAVFLAGAFLNNLNAQLTTTANSNASQLAQVLSGTGVTVNNATVVCPTGAIGQFNNGNSANLGINQGVVLTSGAVAPIPNPGTNFASNDNTGGGDASLNAITTGATQDACILEFDVIPQGNVLNFRYVFGSEEYPEYVCSQYNDVFGFFVMSGPIPGGGNYNGNNIALIPNTGLSVLINTVNSGSPGSAYSASGCQSLAYSQYYIPNTTGAFVTYDGYTTVLNANISVVPCQTYHLKIAIADVGDGLYDSGVFLEASSFVSASTTVAASYDPAGFSSTFEGCVNGLFTITVPNLATSSTPVTYTISGTATNGVDYPLLSGTAYVNPGGSSALVYVDPLTDGVTEGQETVTLTVYDPCTGLPVSSATLNINDKPVDTAYASASLVCAGSTVQLTASGGGTYSWTPTAGLSSPTSPTPTVVVDSQQTYSVDITLGYCTDTKSVTVNADEFTVAVVDSPSSFICPGTVVTMAAVSSGGYNPFTYSWSAGTTPSNAQVVQATPSSTTSYSVTVTDSVGCSVVAGTTVGVDTLLQISLGPDVNICPENVPYTLTVPGGPYVDYEWSNGDTTATVAVSATGSYSVTVSNGTCTFTSDSITITILVPVNPHLPDTSFCAGSSVTLTAALPTYTDVIWSTGDTASSLVVTVPGNYSYTAHDANGCFIVSDTNTVTENALPGINATASPDTICPGASSVLNSGAGLGLQYLWQPTGDSTSSITVTTPGTYIVQVTDRFCSNSDTVVVYGYANPNALIAADTTVCRGEFATFTLVNGPFQTYVWSNGDSAVTSITVNTTGAYTLTVFDGNCTWTSNTVTLSNFPTPIPTLADTGGCSGQTIVLTVEPGLIDIVWNTGDTTVTLSTDTNGTYYYTAADVNGCPAISDTIDVTFLPAPTVNVDASPDTICPGTTSLLTSNATGTSLNYLWSTGDTTADITVSTAGVYSVIVRNAFCPAYDTIEVFGYTHAPITLPNDTTVCEGTSVTISPSGGPYNSYSWNTGATTSSITVDSAGDYWVIVTDSVCSWSSDTFTFSNFNTVNPVLNDTGACQGLSVTLTAAGGLSNVVWTPSGSGSSIVVTVAGDYSYTATDVNGCSVESDTATVTFEPAPAVNIDASPDTICPGTTSLLTSNATGTSLNYLWSTGDTTADITVSTAGVYTVIVRNAFCPAYDTIEVFGYTHAPITLPNDTTVCEGTSVTISPSGGPYNSYSWNTGATTSSITVDSAGDYWVIVTDSVCSWSSDTFTFSNFNTVNPVLNDTGACQGLSVTLTAAGGLSNVVWTPSGSGSSIVVTVAGDYSYTATDVNGCSVESDTATVTFEPAPAVNADAAPDSICAGGSTTISANATGTNLTYSWQPNGETTASITANAAGTYIVSVSNGFCSTNDTVVIGQYTHAPVLLPNDTTVCPGASVVIGPSGGPYVTYTWNSTAAQTSTINANTPGNYWVTVNDGTCNYVSDTFTLSNFAVVTPAAHSDTSVCAGQPVTLSADPGYTNYGWSPSGTGSSITVTTPGTYTYTATDAGGCTVTSTGATVTHIAIPTPNIVASPPALCTGTGQSTLDAGSISGVTYTWNPGGTTGNTYTVTTAGTYSVIAQQGNCFGYDTITILTADTPVVSLPPFVGSCCQEVVLNPGTGAGFTYSWSNGSTDSTVTVRVTGTNTPVNISVTVTSSAGCTSTVATTVLIRCINAEAFANPDSIMTGDSSALNVVTSYDSTGTFGYVWTPSTGLSNVNIKNPYASPTEETVYTVVVSDTTGGLSCTDTASVTVYIIVNDQVRMPNAFTPNGDGRNDEFFPVMVGDQGKVTDFRIYNRWGEQIHNSTSGWDGKFNGKEQPVGTYIYYVGVRIPDSQNPGQMKDVKIQGSFTLLR